MDSTKSFNTLIETLKDISASIDGMRNKLIVLDTVIGGSVIIVTKNAKLFVTPTDGEDWTDLVIGIDSIEKCPALPNHFYDKYTVDINIGIKNHNSYDGDLEEFIFGLLEDVSDIILVYSKVEILSKTILNGTRGEVDHVEIICNIFDLYQ